MDNTTVDELTRRLHEDIVQMIRCGIRAQDIATEFAMSERQVYRIARVAKQPMMYRNKRQVLLMNLLESGKTYEEAGRILGLKPDSAYRMAYRIRRRSTPRSTHLRT